MGLVLLLNFGLEEVGAGAVLTNYFPGSGPNRQLHTIFRSQERNTELGPLFSEAKNKNTERGPIYQVYVISFPFARF